MNHQTTAIGGKQQRGFIALVAVVVFGLILLGVTVEQSLAGWYARFNVLSAEHKEQANALAEGCADQALARLVSDPDFIHDGTHTIGSGDRMCTAEIDVDAGGNFATIASQGVVKGTYANLEMLINLSDVHVGDTVITPSNGAVLITMTVTNDNGGDADLDDFGFRVTGGTPATFNGSATQNVAIPGGGSYQVELDGGPVADYSLTFSGHCDDTGAGDVDPGEADSCIISLDDKPTTITLIANVINNQGGSADPEDFILRIDGTSVEQGVPTPVSPGAHTVSAESDPDYTTPDGWELDCSSAGNITIGVSEEKTCYIVYQDNPAPLQCAETFMMLDRTGSMSGTDLIEERDAANALLNLYQTVTPDPKVAFGVFGAPGSGAPYSAQVRQTLTTNYTDLAIALISGLSTSGGGTNLSSALDVADRELNSNRHVSGQEKVILLLSDGDATHPTNPDSSATATANVVKQGTGASYKHADGIATKIFTIHFGDSGSGGANKDFLASLASGGSSYDPDETTTSYQAPTASSGGAWVTPEGAHAPYGSDSKVASASHATQSLTRDYFQFPFTAHVPDGATISSIEVIADANSSFNGVSSGCRLGVALSWNGGSSWTSQQTRTLTNATTTLSFGGTTAWGGGHVWTSSEVRSSSNFRVRIQDVDGGTSCADTARTNVDYLRVSVGYLDDDSENTDGDYFFVAPTAADMENVFEDVAKLACPAIDGTFTPPTNASLTVVTHVINDNSGTKDANDFEMSVDGNDFQGSESGVTQQLDPGGYNVTAETDSGYTITKDVNCSSAVLGSIEAGESRTCTVTYNDKTPPPTPPDLDIIIGSWKEVPDPVDP